MTANAAGAATWEVWLPLQCAVLLPLRDVALSLMHRMCSYNEFEFTIETVGLACIFMRNHNL